MPRCPSCTHEVPETSRFCPGCGTALDESSATTRTSVSSGGVPPASGTGGAWPASTASQGVGRLQTSGSLPDSRFLPGSTVADRYRIVGLLGQGGMGEVYRADDIKLGQPVALKFLPEALERDPGRLARFLNEVRVARQVSHANVCRVYDVGEVEGKHFLSMEFVDGEDLASLLRRIGRLAPDKAVQIARQICAGLAAAHAQGIVHRDLKPANVMLDGRGQVKITDFGLAGLAEGFQGAEIRVGTPAYMAPEQIAGREVTVRSDIYSLGLVLYELFTGRAAYDAATLAELTRKQQETTPSLPSSLVSGIEPAVERVILRCIEPDPAQRLGTALAVAAALPGGDPLAAALEAGETPSPEMVAAAGESEGLRPAVGLTVLILAIVGLIGIVLASDRLLLLGQVPLDKPPGALVVEARETIARLGHDQEPVDAVWAFDSDDDYLDQIAREDLSPTRWDGLGSLRPAPVFFWYRTSPRAIVAVRGAGRPSYSNPPMALSGMTRSRFDPQGRLLSFLAVPPERDTAEEDASEPDWGVPLAEAGLDLATLQPATPSWNPLVDGDRRAAWEGTYPDQPDLQIRVEAGAYRGKPVYFEVLAPWVEPSRMQARPQTAGQRALSYILIGMLFLLFIGGSLMAWRNLRVGRGDRRGAFRMAGYVFGVLMLAWALASHHVATLAEVALFFRGIEGALLASGLVWVLYVALEPWVRRIWPHALIPWTRLLAGRLRDPLLGRDLLAGFLASVVIAWLIALTRFVPTWLGRPPAPPFGSQWVTLDGIAGSLSLVFALQFSALLGPCAIFFLMVVLRAVLKRRWAAATVAFLIMTTLQILQSPQQPIVWIASALTWAILMLMMLRFGILAGIVTIYFSNLMLSLPLAPDPSVWYAGRAWALLFGIAALACYGFYISLAGRPLFKDSLLEQDG